MSVVQSVFTAALAGMVLAVGSGCDPPSRSAAFHGTEVTSPGPAHEISAPNWDGSTFQLAEHRGKVVLLAFGYTFCPDVCPFTLRRLAEVHEALGDDAKKTAVVFVTVDPERDSIEKLKSYIPVFNGEFFGLRSAGEVMAALLKGYGIKVTRQIPSTPGGYYAVDHTGDVFLIDKSGRLRLTHPHDTTAEDLLADVQALLREASP